MYFDLTDEQQAIKATAHDFLASRFKSERIREIAASADGTDPDGWKQMAELGWAGLALPEEWGGQGLGIVELAVLFEELGYALAPTPLLSNTVVGLALSLCGSDDQRERYLRPLAEGEKRGTPALFDAGSTATPGAFTMEARADGDGIVLDGEKVLVMDAAGADFFLVATADGRRHLVAARRRRGQRSARRPRSTPPAGSPPSASTASASPPPTPCPAAGPSTRRSSTASAWRSPPSRPGSPSGPWRWRSSTPKTASSSAGRSAPTRRSPTAARRCCWRPRTRARPSTAPPGPPTPTPTRCRSSASMAKAYASDAGWRVPDASIQVHGGIGFTWEHDLHFFLKRGRANAAIFGDAKWHRERVAAAV